MYNSPVSIDKHFLQIIAFSPLIYYHPLHFLLRRPELSAVQKFLSFHDLPLGERETCLCVCHCLVFTAVKLPNTVMQVHRKVADCDTLAFFFAI